MFFVPRKDAWGFWQTKNFKMSRQEIIIGLIGLLEKPEGIPRFVFRFHSSIENRASRYTPRTNILYVCIALGLVTATSCLLWQFSRVHLCNAMSTCTRNFTFLFPFPFRRWWNGRCRILEILADEGIILQAANFWILTDEGVSCWHDSTFFVPSAVKLHSLPHSGAPAFFYQVGVPLLQLLFTKRTTVHDRLEN